MSIVKISDVIADFFIAKDMRHLFGIIGAGNAHIFDSVGSRSELEMVCVHHEQAATMAMQTYYRTSDRVTAAVLTTGGGSTNGLTGVVSAWMDSLPGLIVSGNENSKFTREDNPLRIWGVQGYDSSAVVEKVTKHVARVMDPTEVLYELEKAYHIATTGRPGPVWVDIPMDIQAAKIESDTLRTFTPPAAEVATTSLDGHISDLWALLAGAERPVLWLGNGIRLAGAADRVTALVEKLGIPTLVSWAGIDLIDSEHPLVFGRAGVYGQRAGNLVVQNADLVIAIGTRLAIPQIGYVLDEFARDAKLVVVDIDADEVAKHGARVTLPMVADAGEVIDAVLASDAASGEKAVWLEQCERYRKAYPWIGPEHADTPSFINSYQFLDRLTDQMKPNQVVVTDMGTALLSGHQVMRFKDGQRLMTSTGLGEMGYGLPGAIGASFARDRGEVICLNCDGGMMMNLQEIQTMVHHELPIKLFIFNNDGYLMIKHTQTNLFAGRQVAVDRKSGVSCPDFSALAKAWGMPAYQIRTWEDVDIVLPEVQAAKGPLICEVFMDPHQLFLPKLSLAARPDGTIVSPPLEDLSPLVPREELREHMIVGMHEKSAQL
ncbi:thiamine pyrophosphate-binding protein [Sphingomonas sp. Leaf37]|uniref:thiamine pyrophosphate-binding protein n=1 Tax=Sphingomonas sp. Leaf37 TaxID=2876552 RepID=UPI001E622111|nr:thiamine pyrophosphate-binding protein [Sphingomonas sp. Leaf37]